MDRARTVRAVSPWFSLFSLFGLLGFLPKHDGSPNYFFFIFFGSSFSLWKDFGVSPLSQRSSAKIFICLSISASPPAFPRFGGRPQNARAVPPQKRGFPCGSGPWQRGTGGQSGIRAWGSPENQFHPSE